MCVGHLVAAGPRNVLDSDLQIALLQDEPVDLLQRAGAFHKDVPSSAVDHHFSHARIEQQMLEGFHERQDARETAHNVPRATWSK